MRPCTLCGGEGGFWDTVDGQRPMGLWEEAPDFYWIECPHCLGTGREPPPKVRKGTKPKGRLIHTRAKGLLGFLDEPLPF